MIYIELLVVLLAIFIGARVGGIGLGIFGMIGLGILVFGFGLKPGNPPIDVMLIIVAVITAAATLQASGGLDLSTCSVLLLHFVFRYRTHCLFSIAYYF